MKQILTIHVILHQTIKMESAEHTVVMIHFGGTCESEYFRGTVLEGGIDTQVIGADGCGTLSARYILDGHDCEGTDCRIFIENNGRLAPGEPIVTTPVIYTNSPALKWVENAALTGTVVPKEDEVLISIYAEEA